MLNRVTAYLLLMVLIVLSTTVIATAKPTAQEVIPPCPNALHNLEVWHGLTKLDENGNVLCHYDHEHHDDPNAVNDLFGLPGEWFLGESQSQSIAYPWVTSEHENDEKHAGFDWLVWRDRSCLWGVGGSEYPCLKDFRVQVHAVMSHHSFGDSILADTHTRHHSYSGEYRVVNGGVFALACGPEGIVRRGGHLDFRGLNVNGMEVIPPGQAGDGVLKKHLEPPLTNQKVVGAWYGA
ncbi:MAG: hypothetical protein ACRDIB_12840, partial [Ardenticatenaceae bacterium]